jgi:uncharacterized phage-associated protein
MIDSFKIDEEKSNQVLLWIITKFGGKIDFHKLFKILYFAEQKHLTRYGRPIIGDKFIAMKDGPVPSEIYYQLKKIRQIKLNKYFSIENWFYVVALREVDLEELAVSEINCLKESFEENKDLSHQKLSEKSHQSAWRKANSEDNEMSFLEIAKEGGANEEILKYITINLENQKLSF